MERMSKNQTIFLMVVLTVSTIAIDGLLEPILADPLRTSTMSFSLLMGMFWILGNGAAERWPKRTLTQKITFAGVAVLLPLVLHLIRR